MNRNTRLSLTLPVLLLPFACVDRDPVDPNGRGQQFTHVTGGVPGFHFLSPLGHGTSTAGFLGFLSPVVVVCKWQSAQGECAPNSTLAEFSPTAGTGDATIQVSPDGDNVYQVDWNTSFKQRAAIHGDGYQIVVLLGGEVLGTAEIEFYANHRQANNASPTAYAVVDGRTLPIKFGIELAAVEEIEEAGGNVLVHTFSTTGGDEQKAEIRFEAIFQVDGDNIQIPGGGTEFTLVIAERARTNGECVPSYGGANTGGCYVFETIPAGVTFLDGDGNPAGIAGVCPDADATDEYALAKEDDGVTTFPTRADDILTCSFEVNGYRLPRMLRGLARLLLPSALHARDFGETGTVGAFSTLFWAVPLKIEENPSSPLPDAPFTPGETLELSFRVVTTHGTTTVPAGQPEEGVTVNFSVSGGTLSASSAVSDGAGGVDVNWTLPTGTGTHVLTATIAGTGQGALQFTATFGAPVIANFDEDPLGAAIEAGTVVNNTYAADGITFSRLPPTGELDLCGPNVYANDHGPADPWFSGAFGFNSGQNNVSVCSPPIASDFSAPTFGIIRASFNAAVSSVCIDVAPTTPGGWGFLEAFDVSEVSLTRVTSAPGVRQTFCVSATGIRSVRFAGDGSNFAIFDNLQVFFTPPPID